MLLGAVHENEHSPFRARAAGVDRAWAGRRGLAGNMNRSSEAGAFAAGEVIRAIKGAVVFSHPPHEAARKLSHAKARVNTGLAELVLGPLLSHLEGHPRDTSALLALVLMGSAHPDACEEARCSAQEEAERLAQLLESEGSMGWAAAIREGFAGESSAGLSARVREEREAGVGRGSRQPRLAGRRRVRRPRGLIAAGFMLSLFALGMWRELELRERWAAVPPARAGDLTSVEQRVEDLSLLIDESGPWLGLPGVAAERLRLEGELKRLVRAEGVRVEGAARALAGRRMEAEEARERGLLALEAGSLSLARECFAHALERGGEDWQGAAGIAQDLVRLSEVHLALSGELDVQGGGTR